MTTIGSSKDDYEVRSGGFNEEVWDAWLVTWNEDNAPLIVAEMVLKPSRATTDKALLMVLALDTSADVIVSCWDEFARGKIGLQSSIKLLGTALLWNDS